MRYNNQPMNSSALLQSLVAADGASGGFLKDSQLTQSTFIPTFTFGTPGDLDPGYTTQEGYYIRVGDWVWFQMRLAWTPTHTTASGNAIFGGLPFASDPGRAPCTGIFVNLDYGAGEGTPTPRIAPAATTMTLSMQVDDGATVNATTTHFPTATAYTAEISGFYRALAA